MNKRKIRETVLARRSAVAPSERSAWSQSICEKIMELPAYRSARSVMAYYPIRGEVDIMPLLQDILKNKSLLLPRIGAPGCMHAAKISGLDELAAGIFGTMEPNSSCAEALLSDIDLAIVPLVAFSKDCGRLGYGGGYYDRFLSGADFTKIGAAFECQRAETLNCRAHDVKMDKIVTEKYIYMPR
jgi:5-formyltetrahydrofolate cyclo-ligase